VPKRESKESSYLWEKNTHPFHHLHRDCLDSRGADRRVLEKWDYTREVINKVVIGLIVVGFVHYAARQKAEFGSKFDFSKLLFSYGCKNL
jgi:hypothetical protein